MRIRLLRQADIQKWIGLANEVEPLFGPMVELPEFHNAIKICISNKLAWGIDMEQSEMGGIIALDKQQNEIAWLAVARKFRGRGFGRLLVEKAITELDHKRDIRVHTFASNIEEGKAARKIYEDYGFTDHQEAGKNPAGIDTVIMLRKQTDYGISNNVDLEQ